MKQKCSFILRASLALVLTVLMVFGSVSTVIAAVADVAAGDGALPLAAKKGFDIAATGADADVAETGAGITGPAYLYVKTNPSDLSWWNNDGCGRLYLFGGTSAAKGPYDGTVVTINSVSYKRFEIPSGGNYTTFILSRSYNGNDWNEQTGNMTLSTTQNAVTNFGKDWTSPTWGTVQYDSTASLSASKTSATTGENVTLTPSISSNTTYNEYKSVSYSISPSSGASISGNTFTATAAGTYTVTATVTYNAKGFTGITKTATATKQISVTAASCDYYTHVMWRDFGGTTYTPDATYGSVQRNTGTEPTADIGSLATSNTFDGWYVGDNGNATSTTGLTKYPNNTDYTNSSISIAYNSSVKHYYAFLTKPEPSYSVTVAKGTGGSIASTSVTAHPSTQVTLPKATPNYGYKFKNWTATGGITLTNATSASAAKITATGTGTVTANFEKDDSMNLYVAGRFHIYNGSSWVNSFDSGDWSNTGDDNIKFTWDSTAQKYKVNTGASPAELTSQISNINPYFFVYDKTNSKSWYATSSTTLTNSNKTVTLSKSSGANNNLRFNATSTDKPVTLWFDPTTGVLSYDIPAFYDVTVSTATGGSVTASPTRAESGATVTLTISPDTGYQLKSISAKDSSNATVTLSGTGNTRTFTMPAKDVTVTPVFEKISYSVSVAAKYSNNGTDFDQDFASGSEPTVTIGANTATQIDGTTVSASDIDGYVFVGWATNTGSTTHFGNQLNKDTTFKPTSGNTKAIARYKKVFTITSSVESGTGAGTVTTSKTSVEAGGSYTITATAKSGSAVESVKVNGTAKTATASQTISSVSADQTVVVKFKSNVYLKGTMNTTAWAGDVMTANTAGTSYTIANVVLNAGTTYQFRLYADDEWKANSVTTWTLNNIATHGTSGDNLTITPSVKAKVTFVSDGTKFTSITAIPYDSTQYNVTLTQSADYTITSTYMGVEYTTAGKNANVTVPVYSGTGFSYTVTPASGKYLSAVAQSNSVALSPAFSATTHANSYTGTVSSVSKAFAVSATAANKLSVAAKTNKSARGTVSVNKSTAAPGESITITVSPKNGVLKSLTATYGNGEVYTCNLSTKAWTKDSSTPTTGSAAPTAKAYKMDEIASIGANVAIIAVGADTSYTMTLAENSSVTINATFDNYSGDSTWYYNGYDNSGNALSGYHGKQMTEGMVSGEKFSYYHVEGRTGTDQLMTITDGSSPSYGKVYFTNNYNWNNLHVYFYGSSISWNWPGDGMTFEYTNDNNQAVYSYQIPSGATGVIFNNGENGVQTQDIDLTNTNGAYYLTGDGASPYATQWDSAPSDAGITKGIEYFYQNSDHNGDYTGDFNTKGFYNHNTASKEFAKPADLGTNTGDYYINVLYPNTSYTINGVTKTTGNNPMIIWSAEPLAGDDENVTIYAKDGSIRSEAYGSTYANIADTKIYLNNATVGTKHSGNITNQTYETYKAAKGETIVIKTQIGATDSSTLSNAADLKAKYYVRGFCVNGEVSELLSWNADGLYTLTYKIPEDTEITKFEITPIYYLKDTTANPIVTYRVTGFTDELKAVGAGKPNWGDTLYTYPFYGKLGSNNNALGAYPGQPMVYYKGQYQMQIPQKSTAWDIYYDDGALSGYSGDTAKANAVANTAVSGVTMSNGYYDIVHRQVMGYGSNGASADHVQTYDYGDFYKIFNEKKPVDNIVFDFKYETKKHNFENQPAATISKSDLDTNYGTNGNGFELLTNFHGRTVDLFGTPLSGDAADPDKTTPVYVVSIGGVNGSAGVENIAGYYATEWMVYGSSNGTNYTRISAGGKNSIPPEVLVLNDDDATSFNTTTYPSAVTGKAVTDWKVLYTALEAYRGKPVMISYEAADAQIGAGNYATSGGGGATRNDGRWLYSKNGETITSKIRVDVSEDNGATYRPNTELSTPVENLDAYFTNAEADGETTYTTTIDPDKTFDFEAHSGNEDYKFMGWYMEDGTKITTDNIGHTERSGSYTFVARFMHFTGGQLILGHKVAKDSTYKGDGTATIAVKVKNGDEIVREWAASSSDVTIDDKIINNENTAYTIEVTLAATPAGEDSYARTTCSPADTTFFGGHGTYTTMPQTFSFTVGDLFSGNTQQTKKITYNSNFNQVTYTYKYTFNFPSRGSSSNDKSYVREGTLTAAQRKDYVTGTGNESRVLSEAFVNSLAPHESNFNQTLTWSITDTDRTFTQSGSNYTLTKTVNAVDRTAQVDGGATPAQGEVVRTAKRTATFNLPYAHTNGVPSNIEIMDKAESTNYVISGICYGSLVKKDGDNGYIVAPRQLNDGGTVKNFQYWSVKSTDAAGENDPDVARCYFYSFNFVAYDNYVITPVYDTGSTPFGNSNRTSTSITYLESSRNQFNGTGVTTTNMATAADILYNDFVLSYEYNGKDIYKNDDSSSDVSQIGYVVERVQKLEVGQDGTPYTDPNHYSDVTVKSEEEIKNMISSNTGKTVATSGTLTKYTLTKNSLDNKNRVEFYESYINSKGWNEDTQKPQQTSGYKNYVYKAYTYMIVNGVVTLSAPAYFTMYSEATM